jgi:hypothetical protein
MKRFKTVKRTMALGVVVALVVFTGPAKTHAATELGDFCWNTAPFIDTLRLNITQADLTDAGVFQLLHGRWRAGGIYQIPVTGHLSASDSDPGKLAFAIAGSVQLVPSQNDAVALYAVLDPDTMTGPFNLVAASFSPPLRNSGTLTPIACDATTGPAPNGSGTALGK